MADITGSAPSCPGFEGHPSFLGALAGAGFIGTPNAAPKDSDFFDPFGGKEYHGEKTDTNFPVGQSKVGFHGVAGGGGGSGDADGYTGKNGGSIAGGGETKMPPYTDY